LVRGGRQGAFIRGDAGGGGLEVALPGFPLGSLLALDFPRHRLPALDLPFLPLPIAVPVER
jgi:hypothetical protein